MTSEGQGPDLGAILSQLGQMQQHLQQAQESATSQIIHGAAGGGAVKITATGGLDIKEVRIDPSVVEAGDVEMLEDLVLAAVRDLVEAAKTLQSDALGGLGGPGGIGGGLQGLFGT